MKTNAVIALYVCLAAAPFTLAQDPMDAIERLEEQPIAFGLAHRLDL